MLTQTLRSRWFAIAVHLGLWALLYLALIHLGGKAPGYRDAGSLPMPRGTAAPVGKLDSVFASPPATTLTSNAITENPFLTRYFVPPPSPAPPPPPTTRKIEVTYQGFYQTTNGPKFAVLKIGEGLMVARIGALVATNVYVADASMTAVILTNPAAQTNILLLNTTKAIEVPVR